MPMKMAAMILDSFGFIDLLCYGCYVIKCVLVGSANHVGNECSNDFGEGNDDKTNEGVEDGLFGLLKFTRIASRGGIRDTTDNDEDGRNDASDADDPLNGVSDHSVRIGAGSGNTIVSKRAITTHEGDTNSVQDDIGKHNDGETDEGLGEGFLAVGDFAGIAV